MKGQELGRKQISYLKYQKAESSEEKRWKEAGVAEKAEWESWFGIGRCKRDKGEESLSRNYKEWVEGEGLLTRVLF